MYSKLQKHPDYWLFHSMKKRCYCQTANAYEHYGGRGIRVCERWLMPKGEGFRNFISDMGVRPPKHTLERVDVNGNYSPSNCIWATRKAQSNNRRNNVRITLDGITKTATEWAHSLGLRGGDIITRRIANGVPLEIALTSKRVKASPESALPRINAAAEKKRAMTHCKRGHPLSGDNLFLQNGKIRVCRACKRIKSQEYRQKAKEKS